MSTAGIPITHPTPVAVGTSSTPILTANDNLTYGLFVNDSDTVIYLKFGGAAALNDGIRLNANGGHYEMGNAFNNLSTEACFAIHGGTGSKTLLVTIGNNT